MSFLNWLKARLTLKPKPELKVWCGDCKYYLGGKSPLGRDKSSCTHPGNRDYYNNDPVATFKVNLKGDCEKFQSAVKQVESSPHSEDTSSEGAYRVCCKDKYGGRTFYFPTMASAREKADDLCNDPDIRWVEVQDPNGRNTRFWGGTDE